MGASGGGCGIMIRAVFLLPTPPVTKTPKGTRTKRRSMTKRLPCAVCWLKRRYQIEMLEEVPGISSPDITIDGPKADLKRLSSANNIERHAKEAVREQGADIVIFQFDNETEAIHTKLYKLKKMGYKVLYFFTGRENEVFEL